MPSSFIPHPGSPRFGNSDDRALFKLLGRKFGRPSLTDEFRDDDLLKTLLQRPSRTGRSTVLKDQTLKATAVLPQRVAPRSGWTVASFGEQDALQDEDDLLLQLALTPPPVVPPAVATTQQRSQLEAAVLAKSFADTLARSVAEVVVGGAGAGGDLHQLRLPLGVCAAQDGSLLVADTGNSRILRSLSSSSSPEVLVTKVQSTTFPFEPVGLAIDGKGSLFASASGAVELWSDLGRVCHEVLMGKWPTGLVVEKPSCISSSVVSLISCDTFANTVTRCRVSKSSSLVSFQLLGKPVAGSTKLHEKSPWRLRRPFALSISPDQSRLLIADSGNHRVVSWPLKDVGGRRSIDAQVVAGGFHRHGGRLDQLHHPRGVLAESTGAILIADTLNHRIVRWLPGAASGTLVFGGLGCGQRLDQLNQPTSLAFDSDGNLLICDTGNHRILRLARDRLGVIGAGEAEKVHDSNVNVTGRGDDDYESFEDDSDGEEGEEEPWLAFLLEDLKQHFKPIRSGISVEELYHQLLRASKGQLTVDKFKVVVRTYRPELADDEIRQLFEKVNTSNSESISLSEFLACFA